MAEKPSPRGCELCSKPLPENPDPYGRGRPRKFCGDLCRWRTSKLRDYVAHADRMDVRGLVDSARYRRTIATRRAEWSTP